MRRIALCLLDTFRNILFVALGFDNAKLYAFVCKEVVDFIGIPLCLCDDAAGRHDVGTLFGKDIAAFYNAPSGSL